MTPNSLVQLTHQREGMPSRDLDKLGKSAHENFMKFNKVKCKVVHQGCGDPRHKYSLGREWKDSSPMEKLLVVFVDENLNLQCALTVQKASVPGAIMKAT
ncbi:hypothetical protein WISP_134711 [Willisornis vidua]|uniref:Uncharacterized protein n=1 Tax=Willisornis vidua TaxID=1566151 RepID=A0ABQ9CNR8_9PASS|nr:hypothetical protein WISP_134711 [Willisornis vidua]